MVQIFRPVQSGRRYGWSYWFMALTRLSLCHESCLGSESVDESSHSVSFTPTFKYINRSLKRGLYDVEMTWRIVTQLANQPLRLAKGHSIGLMPLCASSVNEVISNSGRCGEELISHYMWNSCVLNNCSVRHYFLFPFVLFLGTLCVTWYCHSSWENESFKVSNSGPLSYLFNL